MAFVVRDAAKVLGYMGILAFVVLDAAKVL